MNTKVQLKVGDQVMNVVKKSGFVEKYNVVDENNNIVYRIIQQEKLLVVTVDNEPVEDSLQRKILSFIGRSFKKDSGLFSAVLKAPITSLVDDAIACSS